MEDLVQNFINDKSAKNAMILGSELFLSPIGLGEKKEILRRLFRSGMDDEIQTILNMWTAAIFLKDENMGVIKRIGYVLEFLRDPFLDMDYLNGWILRVFNDPTMDPRILRAIAPHFLKLKGLSPHIKDLLYSFDS